MINLKFKHILLALCMAPGLLFGGSAFAQFGQISGMLGDLAEKVIPTRIDDASPSMTLEVKPGAESNVAGREIDELTTPKALLLDTPALQKLLGNNPVFVYNPNDRPDPMLVPWTRSNVMFGELKEIATKAIEQKNWQVAEMAYQRMLNLGSEDYRAQAEMAMQELGMIVAKDDEATAIASGKAFEAKMPPWILANTSAVIVDKDEPMCMVGTFILKQGDLVPRQQMEVMVAKIEPAAVHYKILDKTFIVPIREGE